MSRPIKYALFWLSAWSVLLAATLSSFTLLPVAETRYAGVAWEMFHSGQYLVPLSNGEPYAHKPPLLFWLLHLGWLAFGVSAWWPRLAAGLCSLTGLLLTLCLARRLWPERNAVAFLAPTILLGTTLWSLWTPAVMFDVLLSACTLVAVTGIVTAACGRARNGWLLAGLGIGLGALTKGPVIVLHTLPLAMLAPLWHPQRHRLVWKTWYAGIAIALALGAAIALAWAIPAALRGGSSYAQAIFWGQSAGRLVDSFAHRQPLYWYLPWLPLLLFPWSLWPPAWRALARARHAGWQTRLLLAWIIPALVGFSLVSGKQVHYLLPLFPGFALLVAHGLDGGLDNQLSWRDQWPVSAALLSIAGIVLWLPAHAATGSPLPAWVAAVSPIVALLTAACALIALLPMPSLEAQTRVLAGTAVGLVAILLVGVGSRAAPYYDLTSPARFLASVQARHKPVAHVGKYHDRFQFLGRLPDPVTIVHHSQVLRWTKAHPQGYVVAYFDHRQSLARAPEPCYIQPYRSQWLTIWPAATIQQRPDLVAKMD